MKIPIKDVREAFAVCSYVQTNEISESSRFVRLRVNGDKLSMSMTGNLYAEAEVKGAEGGKWTAFVERKAFKAFLDTAKGDELELFYKDKLVLRGGQRLEVAPHVPISGYESWTPKSTVDLTEEQQKVIKASLSYLPTVIAGSEHVDAIYFRKDYGIVSTDTVVIFAILGFEVKSSFFIPPALGKVLSGEKGKIGIDSSSIGLVLPKGFIYQPISADLDKYPFDKLKAFIEDSLKAKVVATIKAKDLFRALRAASQFLTDKNEDTQIEPTKQGIQITIDMSSGRFQRVVPTIPASPTFDSPINWRIKKIAPWLDFAMSIKEDVEVEMLRVTNATIFRFVEAKKTYLSLFADL